MSRLENFLPHEIFFGAFLVSAWVRLAFAQGVSGGQALLYSGLILLNGAAIFACRRRETDLRWRLRLLAYPLMMNVVFFGMGAAVGAMHPGKEDAFLQRIDQALFGKTPCLAMESLVTPALTEALSFCYLVFFPYLTIAMITYFFGDLATLKKFFAGLFTIYGLGFIGYSLVPASGPHVAMADQFRIPLEGGWITDLNRQVVLRGSNGVDVFPSLHCAVSCFILLFDFTHCRRRFYALAIPCFGLWISTVYLRYHYLIDVLVGFALAAACLWMVSRMGRKEDSPGPAPRV